jgi:hypothetical protein
LGRAGADENAPIQIVRTEANGTQLTLGAADLISSLKPAGKDLVSMETFDDGSRIETTTAASGKQTTTTYDSDGAVYRRAELELNPNGTTLTTVRDGQGATQSTTTTQTFDDGSRLETTRYPDGREVQSSYDTEGSLDKTLIAQYSSAKGLTEVSVYEGDELQSTAIVEGQATQADLDKVRTLSEQVDDAPSLGATPDSPDGKSLLTNLGVIDATSQQPVECHPELTP